jgi:lipoate-protein ligase A
MGLNAAFEGKSNIAVNGFKISGNSAHVFRGRVLHHGTLLFETDLDILDKVLITEEERSHDRSVQSIRKEVSNISPQLNAVMSVEDFMESFFSFIINYYEDAYLDRLSSFELEEIGKLAREKYYHAKWNIGYSPDYQFSSTWSYQGRKYNISMTTREAIIESIKIEGPQELSKSLNEFEKLLIGVLHERNSVADRLKKINFATDEEIRIFPEILDKLF